MSRPFAHLHCHTHYSLLDGASRVPELVEHVKSHGMSAVAVTDHGNLYGAVEFYREATAAGVNPILGYEAYVAPGGRTDREARRRGDAGYHLTLLAKNNQGFKNLIKMASIAFLEGYHYVPRIDKELLEAHSEGIICLSGCLSSEFNELILKDQVGEAQKLAEWFIRVFGKNFYVEIQKNGIDLQDQCTVAATDIADKLGVPLVATCDAHYLNRNDAQAHDVLLCINTGKLRSDPNRLRYSGDQFFVRSPDEVYALFPNRAEAVKQSQIIADSCDVKLDFKARHFPAFTPPKKKTLEAYLRELCEAGLKERYGENPPDAARARLEHELGIITRMGFASYFLVVWDFVRFADEHGIPASARGSACGSIVSYVLRLSHVCPLEYDLLFERFLDPNRSEAPDIDIDFCQERREDVIAYVRNKYGEASVAQIATFGTMAAKAALKDVGRVLDIPLERVNALTKMVPQRLGVTIDDAIKESPEFRKEYEKDPLAKEWINIARTLEGTNRQAGVHAAGVVIANGPLNEYVPLARSVRKGDDSGAKGAGEAVVTTQWTMGDLEKVGLLKMDFLGLRTLTVLDNAVKLIKKTRGDTIDLYRLPLDDRGTYELLQRGDAKGVFQFESDGIRELLKRMKPDNIRDIIACTALYRPGPLGGGMVDAYVNRKHGREKPEYHHEVMKSILEETYGIMVYQEQVMRILNQLGGIDLSNAYACIKAISKKKQDIIDARQADFIRGAQERGVSEAQAKEIFGLIVFFGGYGFNKSHSAAYAYVSYQTAYLKSKYTPEFMASLLSSEIDDGNKRDILVDHIADARRLGVAVRPPNVNEGESDFTVRNGEIVFGLTAIKGLGRGAASEIARARGDTPFRDIFDFCERIDLKIVPRAALERLIKAGGFDSLHPNRAALYAALPRALQSAGELQQDRKRGQKSFFDAVADEAAPTGNDALAEGPDWPSGERLKYEKEALDFYFSSHPLAEHAGELSRFASHTVEQLKKIPHGSRVLVGGMLTQVRFMNVKKARNGNTRYVRCKIEDATGLLEAMMWPDDFVKFKDDFADDRILFAEGTIEQNREEPQLLMQRVFNVDTARKEMTKGLILKMELERAGTATLEELAKTLRKTPGPCPVYVQVSDATGRRAVWRVGDRFRVNPAEIRLAEIEMLLGPNTVAFTAR
ncbi:MAG: DNA polymerase III subunit alpha [Gemmataceae bacterium]|nr:DNA polymerase III subunit alpha [Gemmataceae bacterium]